jgi:hypothetical protein
MSGLTLLIGVGAILNGIGLAIVSVIVILLHPWLVLIPVVLLILNLILLRRQHLRDRVRLAIAREVSGAYAEQLVAHRQQHAERLQQRRVAANPANATHTSLVDLEHDEAEAVHRLRSLRRVPQRHPRFWETTDWD